MSWRKADQWTPGCPPRFVLLYACAEQFPREIVAENAEMVEHNVGDD